MKQTYQAIKGALSQLPRSARSAVLSGGALVILLSLIAAVATCLSLSLRVMNNEYSARGKDSVSVLENDKAPVALVVYVHDLQLDTNSATVSIVATPKHGSQQASDEIACGHLLILDRAQFEGVVEKVIAIPCTDSISRKTRSFESDRFNVKLLASIDGFPADKYRLSLIINFLDSKGRYIQSSQTVAKAAGTRNLKVRETGMNWEVEFSRPAASIIYIYSSAAIFLLITIGISVAMWRGQIRSAGDGMITIAGYFLAAAGFRSLLGFDRTVNTTIFELTIFGLPMLILGTCILAAMAHALTRQSHPGPR